MKGLNSPILTTELRFQFSEKSKTGVSLKKGILIHNTLTFRDEGKNKHKA